MSLGLHSWWEHVTKPSNNPSSLQTQVTPALEQLDVCKASLRHLSYAIVSVSTRYSFSTLTGHDGRETDSGFSARPTANCATDTNRHIINIILPCIVPSHAGCDRALLTTCSRGQSPTRERSQLLF